MTDRPELIHLSQDVLLVQSFESFALAVQPLVDPTAIPGVSVVDAEPDRYMGMLVFSGRWNRREETDTFAVAFAESMLVNLIEGLQRQLRVIQEEAT